MFFRITVLFLFAMTVNQWPISAQVLESCSNGIDDNADGFVDCEDQECATGFIRSMLSPILNSDDTFYDYSVVDYDNDGDLDFICYGTANGSIFSNGRVTRFTTSDVYPLRTTREYFSLNYPFNFGSNFSGPSMRKLHDFTGDGKLDLVYASGSKIRLFQWLSDGTTQDGEIGSFPDIVSSFEFYDSDFDGDLDILVGTEFFGVRVMNNNGNGNFDVSGALCPTSQTNYVNDFGVADFDANGLQDFVVLKDNFVMVYERFPGPAGIDCGVSWGSGGPSSGSYTKLDLFDYDSDGDFDIVLSSSSISSRLLINDGEGNFDTNISFPDSNSGELNVSDLNSDGLPDLWRTNGTVNYINDGLGGVVFEFDESWGSKKDVFDLDGDGNSDYLLSGFGVPNSRLSVQLNGIDSLAEFTVPPSNSSVEFAKFGSSQFPIAISRDTFGYTNVFVPSVQGGYQLIQSIEPPASDFKLADLNSDGYSDLMIRAATGGNTYKLSLYHFNQALVQYDLVQEIIDVRFYVPGHFNDDADIDLFIVPGPGAQQDVSEAVVWTNQSGLLSPSGGFFAVNTFSRPIAGDFDNDGVDDIAIDTNDADFSLEVLRNVDLNFVETYNSGNFPGSDRLLVSDFNNDGRLDIVNGNVLMLNAGNFNFVAINGFYDNPVKAFDFDLDGFMDFQSYSYVFMNNRLGGFDLFPTYSSNFTSFYDVDGDGDVDRSFHIEGTLYIFGNGSDSCSTDLDFDGIPNECDVDITLGIDCDSNNIDDSCELDQDNDGEIDACDSDIDGDGVPNECDPTTTSLEDCDNSGVADSCEIDQGLLSDCDLDGVPDNCEYTSAEDCNSNGLLDSCDILVGISHDCSGNGIPDECEIQSGSVADCNSNGVPDQCDYLTDPDCNSNGILDSCDIGLGIDTDCDLNGIPDLCDLLAGADCNSNGVLDACDISGGFSEDCDGNQVPDSCDIAGGAVDDDSNGIPDNCEPQAFRRGDLNIDGTMDVSDAVFGLEFLFGTQTVTCEDAADANDDGNLNIGDAVFILSALFNSGDLPPDPGSQSCGLDPTVDSLNCEVFGGCP